jgi:hypothetical protein
MKIILFILVALALIGGGVGFYLYNKPVESLARKKADVTVTADQLISEYEQDEKAADQKYLGKVVEVTGKITDVTEEQGTQKVSLETANPLSAVICEMEGKMPVTDSKSGDQVTIKGMCSGYLNDVQLVQCTLVK